jgi:hypothetical protein
MASFADVHTEEPQFAARVRASFDAHGHKVLATLHADGSPGVSGIEARFLDGELWMSTMPRSAEFEDHRHDPRMALHSGSDEPEAFRADRKVSGRAVAVPDPTTRAAFARFAAVPEELSDFELFRIDLDQVVRTEEADDKSALVISSWRPGRGLRRSTRT